MKPVHIWDWLRCRWMTVYRTAEQIAAIPRLQKALTLACTGGLLVITPPDKPPIHPPPPAPPAGIMFGPPPSPFAYVPPEEGPPAIHFTFPPIIPQTGAPMILPPRYEPENTATAGAVAEPATLFLLGASIALLGLASNRRKPS